MTSYAVGSTEFDAGVSRYNWRTSGTSFVQTIYEGASLRWSFTGTSFSLGVDVSSYAGFASGVYPEISYSIDGGAFTDARLTSGATSVTLASGLSDTTHTVVVLLKDLPSYGEYSRWDGTLSFKATSAGVDDGKAISAPAQPSDTAIFFGDSITSGVGINPSESYAALVAASLDAQWCPCAIPSQGWASGPVGVPSFPLAWDLLLSGQSRSFDPAPDYVFINHGRNGSATASAITDTLEGIRAAVGPACRIYLIVPFDQSNAFYVNGGFDDYQTANPSDSLTELIDLGVAGEAIMADTDTCPDGVHPNEAGSEALFDLLAPYLQINGISVSTTNLSANTLTIG